MKSLKFDHKLAQLILDGEKTSTWRLFDDKDLSVGDEVKLIDKVNPDRPETWKTIGTARINTIVQKRLGDITAEDYEAHEQFSSNYQMIETYKKYYGADVTPDTVVKIIRFTFDNNKVGNDSLESDTKVKLTEVKLYADGGSRGNPGPSSLGYVILDMNDHIVVKKGTYLGITTNNQAEYQALKAGMEEASRMRVQKLHVYMDSLLVINQMLGKFKVKNRDLWPLYTAIKELSTTFKQVSYTHVPRALNKLADGAVNEALDAER